MLIQINTNIVAMAKDLFPFRFFIYRWKRRKNVIIFGADMSSSVHIDNKNKDVLSLGEGPTQGLDHTTLTAEAKYPTDVTQLKKDLYYVYTIMGAALPYLLMLQKYINSK